MDSVAPSLCSREQFPACVAAAAPQGYDVTQHVLACFGGAGGQHACAIAAALGIRTIFVHRYSGILSAVGIGLAEVVQEAQVSWRLPLLSLQPKLWRCHSYPSLPPQY